MKKRLLPIIAIVLVIINITFLSINISANTETENVGLLADSSESYGNAADAQPSFFERLKEAWDNEEIQPYILYTLNILSCVFILIVRNGNKKGIVSVKDENAANRRAIVGAVNNVVDQNNAISKTVDSIKIDAENTKKELLDFGAYYHENILKTLDTIKNEQEKAESQSAQKINACGSAVVAFASMMQIIYSNSTTIPQSTKNLVNQKYLEVCKAFEVDPTKKGE